MEATKPEIKQLLEKSTLNGLNDSIWGLGSKSEHFDPNGENQEKLDHWKYLYPHFITLERLRRDDVKKAYVELS